MRNRETALLPPPTSPDPAEWARECDRLLDWLNDAEAYHQARLKDVQQDREAVERVRLLHLKWQAESSDPGDALGAHSHVSPGDIAHCTSIKGAYTEIACRSDGLLKCAAAAKLLLAAGLSKSKDARHLADDIRKRLLADADWEHHSPGIFRYRPYAEGRGWAGSLNGSSPASTLHIRPSPVYGKGGDGPN